MIKKAIKKTIQKALRPKGYKVVQIFPRPMTSFIKNRDADKLLVGCEIGVYQGENAEWMLKTLPIKKLYLIDPYLAYDTYAESLKHEGKDYDSLSDAEKEMRERIRKFGSKVEIIKDKAEKKRVVDKLPLLDFVYIDGNHQYEFVKKDIEIYYNRIKDGGVIGGDDIDNGITQEHDEVMKAVLEFVQKNNLKLFVGGGDWWVVKGLSG